MFYKANVASLKCMMAAFMHFSKCSSQEANLQESHIVLAGVPAKMETAVLKITGFQREGLPFK